MDNNKQPGIKIDSIMLARCEFWRDPQIPKRLELEINFDYNFKISDDEMSSTSKLEIKVSANSNKGDEIEKKIDLTVEYVGIFSVDSEEKNMTLEEFLSGSAPAILYQHAREHILSLTLKAGLKPIYLPVTNISALLKEKEADLEQD